MRDRRQVGVGAAGGALALVALLGCPIGSLTDGAREQGDAQADASRLVQPDASGNDAGGPKKTFLVIVGGAKSGSATTEVRVAEILEGGDLGDWHDADALPVALARGGVISAANRLLVVGGENSGGATTAAFESTSATSSTGVWFPGPTMPSPRTRHGAASSDGHVYLVGGEDATFAATADVLVADVSATGDVGSWRHTTPLTEARSGSVVLAWNHHLYVLTGGRPAALGSTASGSVSDISPTGALGAWRDVAPSDLPTSSGAGGMTATHVYVSGGYAIGPYDVVSASALQADGSLGSWFRAGTMGTGRAGHAAVINRGHFYAIGGTDTSGHELTSVEVADILDGGMLSAFRPARPLPQPRAFLGAVVVSDP